MGKVNAAKLAGVVENQGAIFLVEDEVVVFGRGMIRGRDREFAGHAEVQAEPEIVGEAEEHLFAGGFGGDQFLPSELWKEGEVVAAEDAFIAVEMDAEDFGVEAGIPLAAVIIDFGEFGHGGILDRRFSIVDLEKPEGEEPREAGSFVYKNGELLEGSFLPLFSRPKLGYSDRYEPRKQPVLCRLRPGAIYAAASDQGGRDGVARIDHAQAAAGGGG